MIARKRRKISKFHIFTIGRFIEPCEQYLRIFDHLLIVSIIVFCALVSPVASSELPPIEYTDNQYGYAFQFPADWKLQKTPPPNEIGETRVVVKSPRGDHVTVAVGMLDKAISKRAFQSNPKRRQMVDAMIDFTIEQVYKKTSRDVGATRMMVADRSVLPSEVGIMFYINTVHFVGDKVLVIVTGIHAIPFDENHLISFVMTGPVNPSAKRENEACQKVFQSFHLSGEKPVSGR